MTTATGLKPPPKFVHNLWAWEHTLARLAEKDKLTPEGNPQSYAAASAIYKATVAKYGDMDAVPDTHAFELASRSLIVELESDAWSVSRGSAWTIDDRSTNQMWLEPTFREAKHPLAPTGMKVIEPVVLWNVRLMRADGENVGALIESPSALWVTRDAPAAHSWVRGEIETTLGRIDDELGALDAKLLEIGEIEVDARFFDEDGTRAVMKSVQANLEEALHG